MRLDLGGRRALVTGANSGIGAAIAEALARCGADVALHHWGNAAGAQAVAGRIATYGRRASIHEGDFGKEGAAARLAEETSQGGDVDILVSNVAIQTMEAWDEITLATADLQWRVNYLAPLMLAQALIPPMAARGWGRAIFVGSVQQARPHPQMLVYASLKSAQENMVRSLGAQVAARGITVNMLAPGVIETDRTRPHLDAHRGDITRAIPVGFVGQPEDVSGLAVFLATDAARYLTGQSIFVDGGMGGPAARDG